MIIVQPDRLDALNFVGRAIRFKKILGSVILIFGILIFNAGAQEGIEAYNRGLLTEARACLQDSLSDPDETDFLRAALSTDADSALVIYRQIVLRSPESSIAKRALDRVRQYYYAQGLYTRAEEIGETLGDWKPPRRRLRQPESTPPPPFQLSATLPPQPEIRAPEPEETILEQPATEKSPSYALQVGAFSNAANARRLRDNLEKEGYKAIVLAPDENPTNLHVVRIRGYESVEAALTAADKLHRQFGVKPIVVPADEGE